MAIDPEILQKFKKAGPCVSPGAEIWFLSGRKLNVGKISKITPGREVEVETATGKIILNPEDVLTFTQPIKAMGPVSKKGKGMDK